MSAEDKILLLYTGGTIGMVPDPITGVLRPFNLDGLLSKVPELERLECSLELKSLEPPIDSSDMAVAQWQEIADIIAENYHDYSGFVLLHGSDTMAFTASVLSFMLRGLEKAVVLTGSQLPIGVMRSDARENLLTALEIASAKDDQGKPMVPEVCVYFEYDLYRGNRTHKENTEDFEAFRSPNYPKLAEAGVRLKFRQQHILKPRPPFTLHRELNTHIGIIYLYPGINAELVERILKTPGYNVFILLTFGAGNAPNDARLIRVLDMAIREGKVICNVSQCRTGGMVQGNYAASEQLREIGVVGGSDILFEAAWAKLMHLQGLGLSAEHIKTSFRTPLCGEMTGIENL